MCTRFGSVLFSNKMYHLSYLPLCSLSLYDKSYTAPYNESFTATACRLLNALPDSCTSIDERARFWAEKRVNAA